MMFSKQKKIQRLISEICQFLKVKRLARFDISDNFEILWLIVSIYESKNQPSKYHLLCLSKVIERI